MRVSVLFVLGVVVCVASVVESHVLASTAASARKYGGVAAKRSKAATKVKEKKELKKLEEKRLESKREEEQTKIEKKMKKENGASKRKLQKRSELKEQQKLQDQLKRMDRKKWLKSDLTSSVELKSLARHLYSGGDKKTTAAKELKKLTRGHGKLLEKLQKRLDGKVKMSWSDITSVKHAMPTMRKGRTLQQERELKQLHLRMKREAELYPSLRTKASVSNKFSEEDDDNWSFTRKHKRNADQPEEPNPEDLNNLIESLEERLREVENIDENYNDIDSDLAVDPVYSDVIEALADKFDIDENYNDIDSDLPELPVEAISPAVQGNPTPEPVDYVEFVTFSDESPVKPTTETPSPPQPESETAPKPELEPQPEPEVISEPKPEPELENIPETVEEASAEAEEELELAPEVEEPSEPVPDVEEAPEPVPEVEETPEPGPEVPVLVPEVQDVPEPVPEIEEPSEASPEVSVLVPEPEEAPEPSPEIEVLPDITTEASVDTSRAPETVVEPSSEVVWPWQQYREGDEPCGQANFGRENRLGEPPSARTMLKILQGKEALPGSFPWQVAILTADRDLLCGGSLIAPRWVMTAAHCIKKKLHVRLSEHHIHQKDGREIELKVRRIFRHPDYNSSTIDNDIALLRLPSLPAFRNNLTGEVTRGITDRVCLPNNSEQFPPVGRRCLVMGWGKGSATGRFGTDTLMYTRLPIISRKACQRANRKTITENMFCAGHYKGGADTCSGDSGGPLLCTDGSTKSSGETWTVHGVTSFGDGCGVAGKMGVYAKVNNYLDWIAGIMRRYM